MGSLFYAEPTGFFSNSQANMHNKEKLLNTFTIAYIKTKNKQQTAKQKILKGDFDPWIMIWIS